MAQNVYDDERFFDRYSLLPRSVLGLAGAPEWPVLRSLLPAVDGRHVVDLGCGFGWFCRYAETAGAASVLGLDLSDRMLDRARADTSSETITYRQENLDDVELDAHAFDIAYSSLTLHYIADLDRLLRQVRGCLTLGGHFVFSVEHPIFTAPSTPSFITGPNATPVWPLDQYLVEGPRTTDWLASEVVKHHRTIGTYVNALHGAGFRLADLVEWGPTPEQIEDVPAWSVECDRPPFLLVGAVAE